MRKFLRQEDGFALVLALALAVVLTALVTGVITYTTSNQGSAKLSSAQLAAKSYAEAALNSAYSVIWHQNTTPGGNPTAANLLGCWGATSASDKTGPSDCSTGHVTPELVCFTVSGSACTAGAPGTATVYGYWSGNNPQTFLNRTVPAANWLLVATGYAGNAAGRPSVEQALGTVFIDPSYSAAAVASVWNHIFMTAPLDPNTCQANFAGNNMLVDVPLYVIGNLCLSGQGTVVKETTQPVDLMVGGKLVLSGSGSSVGDYSTNPATPITSGVIVGGCTTGTVTSAASPCANGSYRYSVKTTDTYVSNDSPSASATDQANDYSQFDPGPKHTCQTGTTPSPLADAAFDSSVATNEGSTNPLTPPDDSGSTTNGTAFELTPSFSYACISKNGSNTGYLIWNNNSTGSITVGGITVAAKTLAIGGNYQGSGTGAIFFDSNVTISQAAYYTGTATIEAAGTFTFNGNGTYLCAVSACNFNNWQGTSGNNSMITLVSLASNTTAITFTNNAQTFQGSFWTQPTSTMTFLKNGVTVEGPLAVGGFDATFNNATFEPLPAIKNMPVGAPVPPNIAATIHPLQIVG